MNLKLAMVSLAIGCAGIACSPNETTNTNETTEMEATDKKDDFAWTTEQFADLKIIRYQIPGFEKLTPKQRKLVYFLTQAGYEGRDIIWDQNYRHNLTIRKALEAVIANYSGDKATPEWNQFMTYTKRVWFSNGIHHHYSYNKINPEFSRAYFESLLSEAGHDLSDEVLEVIFNPEIDKKKVNKADGVDLLLTSATNFYDPDITQKEAEAFYAALKDSTDKQPVSYGLNSKLVRMEDGSIKEEVWSIKGMYGPAIERITYWLRMAIEVAENPAQAEALELLIQYYETGDLKMWDAYNIAWTKATEGDIDYINSFIEVYNDPLGYRGSYETVVQIKDFDASARMKVVDQNVQWFEDNSPIADEFKKEKVVGVTYKVVNVAGEAGDASPSTPIGVNLPNANWIRAEHGSKSVSLGNIVQAYEHSSGGGYTDEFAYSQEEKDRAKAHSTLSSKLHTALHEVVGHASGKLNDGVGTPKETLKNYSSTLEEGRADLVALYYIMDQKMLDLGLMKTLDVGKAEYDGYIRNGLMVQLRRIEEGEVIEEDHMRNRQLVAAWAYEKGQAENVIEKKVENGKTYFVINDYEKLRVLFGELLAEIQRIKSEGDFEAGRSLVETYGVQVDPELHKEVLERSASLNIAPFGGFINPRLVPVMEGENISDIKVEYPDNFTNQMLEYSSTYGNL